MQFHQGVGPWFADSPPFQVARQAVLDHYQPKADTAFFTVCSWAKPMNQSYLHYRIRYWLHRMRVLGQMDYIHVSSAGIIPSLCVNWYPFNAYDWNNAMADAETLSYMRGRIADHFDRFNARKHYSQKIVYLRGGSNTARALETTSAISQCETVDRKSTRLN